MQDIGRLLQKAARQLKNSFNKYGSQFNLTNVQMSFIDHLHEHAGQEVLQRDLEQEFKIKRSTATKILQGMEKHNLIARAPSSHDARQRTITLTRKGQECVKIVQDYMLQQQQQLQMHFPPDELASFVKILQYYQKEEG